MGRGLVIITTAMVFIFGIVQMGIVNRHNVETGINIDYATWVQARNVAASGADVAMMELRRNAAWRPTGGLLAFQIDSVMADVVLTEPATDTTLAANQIRVTSESTMGRRTARVNAVMQRGGNIPTIEAAIGIYTEGANFTANGTAFTITGEDGKTDDADMKYGIATGNTDVYDEVTGSIGNQQVFQVKGKGGAPSIAEVDNINEELIEIAAIYAEYAKDPNNPNRYYFDQDHSLAAQDSLGSELFPHITYVEEGMELTLTGGAKGGGVLVLGQDATLTMKGGGNTPFNFYGLVIVLGSAKIRGHMNITGALMFGGESETLIDVEISGNIDVAYSSKAMEDVENFLKDSAYEFATSYRLVSYYE
jgi:hypothetical protein